jgi:hypothetical protein
VQAGSASSSGERPQPAARSSIPCLGVPNYYLADEGRQGICPGRRDNDLSRYYGVTEGQIYWEGRPSFDAAKEPQPTPQPTASASAR